MEELGEAKKETLQVSQFALNFCNTGVKNVTALTPKGREGWSVGGMHELVDSCYRQESGNGHPTDQLQTDPANFETDRTWS